MNGWTIADVIATAGDRARLTSADYDPVQDLLVSAALDHRAGGPLAAIGRSSRRRSLRGVRRHRRHGDVGGGEIRATKYLHANPRSTSSSGVWAASQEPGRAPG